MGLGMPGSMMKSCFKETEKESLGPVNTTLTSRASVKWKWIECWGLECAEAEAEAEGSLRFSSSPLLSAGLGIAMLKTRPGMFWRDGRGCRPSCPSDDKSARGRRVPPSVASRRRRYFHFGGDYLGPTGS